MAYERRQNIARRKNEPGTPNNDACPMDTEEGRKQNKDGRMKEGRRNIQTDD